MRKALSGIGLGCLVGVLLAGMVQLGAASLPQMLGFGRTSGGVNVPLLVDAQGRLATSGGGGGVPAGWTWNTGTLAAPAAATYTIAMPTPTGLAVNSLLTDGSLPAGEYYIKIVAVDPSGGTSLPSNEVHATITAPNDGVGDIVLDWNQVGVGSQYRIYYGSTPGGEAHYVGSGGLFNPGFFYDLSGAVVGTPPVANTAFLMNLPSFTSRDLTIGPSLTVNTLVAADHQIAFQDNILSPPVIGSFNFGIEGGTDPFLDLIGPGGRIRSQSTMAGPQLLLTATGGGEVLIFDQVEFFASGSGNSINVGIYADAPNHGYFNSSVGYWDIGQVDVSVHGPGAGYFHNAVHAAGLQVTGLTTPTNKPVCFDASGNLVAGTNTAGTLSCP